jgi:transcriptional regulator with XRE-family HTH domain
MRVAQERLDKDDLSALRRDLGQKIAAGRRAKKELQRDLAIKLSTSQQNVSKLERGVSVLIPSLWIPKLAEYLDAAQGPSSGTLAATLGDVESETCPY